MLEQLSEIMTIQGLGSLVSLTGLEIVLGIDNLVFIALIIQHLPGKTREQARRVGLSLALGLRIMLLFSIAWLLSLNKPFLSPMGHDFSGKDILLILGGLFLFYKSVGGVNEMFDSAEEQAERRKHASLTGTIIQIMFIDLVFSFDSVITAVGLTKNIPIIIVAMTIAMFIMLLFTGFVSDFIAKYPTLKVLAISFILLIGVILIAEGFGYHIPRGYVYFAMGFSCLTEALNIFIRVKKNRLGLSQH